MITPKRLVKAVSARMSRVACNFENCFSSKNRFCNSCSMNTTRFYTYGNRPFGCPRCGSSTRERFVIHCIDSKTLAPPEQDFLHVAPNEIGIIRRFEHLPGYRPVDLFPEIYPATQTKRCDLMELGMQDELDVAYLSHVMEHVPCDKTVLENLFQALRTNGRLWILVPLWDKPTVDGTSAMTGKERERAFGQWDHVRQYGPDIAQRMEAAGFQVDTIQAGSVDQETFERLGLNRQDWIFCGTKP